MSDIFDSEAFCPLAWNGIYINPQGKVDNCCISDNNLGNINDQTIESIVNGPKARAIRQSMLRGEIIDGCKACYPARKETRTLRHSFVDYYRNKDRSLFQSADSYQLKYADFRLRNTCNYGCMYCGPELSSTIAAEEKIFPILKEKAFAGAVDYLLENTATLDRLYLAGGEPLLIKENELLISEIARTNPACHILVNTNLSQSTDNKIFKLLLELPNVQWLISVEDMDDRYEYIRYLGKWNIFYKNLIYLRSKVSFDRINFNMVFLALNARSIFDFIKWLQQQGFDSESIGISWVTHKLWDPCYLPSSYRKKIFESIDALSIVSKTNLRKELTKIRNRLEDTPYNNPQDLLDSLERLDQQRNLNFGKTFPELYEELTKTVKIGSL